MSRLPLPRPEVPFRDVSVTAQMLREAFQRACPICGTRPETSRATYCSQRCRMVAFRRRHAQQALDRDLATPGIAKPSREHVVYECPGCQTRFLGRQRCDDCHRFCRRLGPGGYCPGCSEVVTIDELLER